MHYEFAVDPELFDDEKTWQFFLQQFGLERGRFISEFPKHWPLKVLDYCEKAEIPDVAKQRLIQRLQDLKFSAGGLLDCSRKYTGKVSWIKNALAENHCKTFRAIITDRECDATDNTLHTDGLVDTEPRWNVPRQDKISRTPEALADCCDVLLSQSREILFADPYFYPDQPRFVNTLTHFLKTLEARKRQRFRIEYHLTCRPGDNSNPQSWCDLFRADCEKCLPKQIPSGMKITFFVWDDKGGGERFHARYVMTELGGITFDSGLDSGHDDTTDVTLMDPHLRKKGWESFQEETAAFELVGKVPVTGE